MSVFRLRLHCLLLLSIGIPSMNPLAFNYWRTIARLHGRNLVHAGLGFKFS